MTLDEIDLMDLDHFAESDPRPAFKLLRDKAPVYWHERKPGQGFWCISKYEDVVSIYRDAAGFSSANGTAIDFAGRTSHPIAKKMMLYTDPPLHMQIRRIVNSDFLPRALESVVPHIHRVAGAILDDVMERGECEFVYDIAGKIPTYILCQMMGIPDADRPYMLQIADDIIGATDPAINKGRPIAEVAGGARDRFKAYCEALIEERRKSPRDDFVSRFAQGRIEIENRPISTLEVLASLLNLIIGGQETTRNTAAGALLLFLRDPERRAEFEGDPGSPLLTDEILRYLSPAYHSKREAARDVQVRGQAIRSGDIVVLWNISANFDEDQFSQPERFDHRRTPNRHVAFGVGEHACIGQHLARLELRILFEHITRRLGDIELAGPVEKLRSNLVYGVRRMPIRFKPKAGRLQ
jgi:cytochrome P450